MNFSFYHSLCYLRLSFSIHDRFGGPLSPYHFWVHSSLLVRFDALVIRWLLPGLLPNDLWRIFPFFTSLTFETLSVHLGCFPFNSSYFSTRVGLYRLFCSISFAFSPRIVHCHMPHREEWSTWSFILYAMLRHVSQRTSYHVAWLAFHPSPYLIPDRYNEHGFSRPYLITSTSTWTRWDRIRFESMWWEPSLLFGFWTSRPRFHFLSAFFAYSFLPHPHKSLVHYTKGTGSRSLAPHVQSVDPFHAFPHGTLSLSIISWPGLTTVVVHLSTNPISFGIRFSFFSSVSFATTLEFSIEYQSVILRCFNSHCFFLFSLNDLSTWDLALIFFSSIWNDSSLAYRSASRHVYFTDCLAIHINW